jgi:hypothetical protein
MSKGVVVSKGHHTGFRRAILTSCVFFFGVFALGPTLVGRDEASTLIAEDTT